MKTAKEGPGKEEKHYLAVRARSTLYYVCELHHLAVVPGGVFVGWFLA